MPYAPALDLQQRVHQAVLNGQCPPTLLLLEHPPVITLSQRHDVRRHLLADPPALARCGIDLQTTDRGGDITYHGPGQLVAYPILRLASLRLNVSQYMRLLELIVIDTVAAWGVDGFTDPGYTGVWVRTSQPQPAKLCALGVRVRRNVTLHGLALNVAPDLAHFDTIIPCGLAGRAVTSLKQLLGQDAPSMDSVKTQLVACFRRRLLTLSNQHPGPTNP